MRFVSEYLLPKTLGDGSPRRAFGDDSTAGTSQLIPRLAGDTSSEAWPMPGGHLGGVYASVLPSSDSTASTVTPLRSA